MFPANFFAPSFFAPEYFSELGAASANIIPIVELDCYARRAVELDCEARRAVELFSGVNRE